MKNSFCDIKNKLTIIWTKSPTCPAGFVLANTGADSAVEVNKLFRKYSTVHFDDTDSDTHTHTVNQSHTHGILHTHLISVTSATQYCTTATKLGNANLSTILHEHQSPFTSANVSSVFVGDVLETLTAQDSYWEPPFVSVLYCKRIF